VFAYWYEENDKGESSEKKVEKKIKKRKKTMGFSIKKR
jgi:hypothetical protein